MNTLFFQAPPATGTAKTPEDRKTEFVPVEGGPKQTTSAETLVVAAYMVMWALLLGFVFLSWRRARRIEDRVESLERELKKRDGESAES